MNSVFTSEDDIEIKKLYESGKTAQQIADSYDVYKQSVLTSLKRTGTPRRQSWGRATGAKSAKWKGGNRYIKGKRHVLLSGHNISRKDGYTAEHRVIMQDILGRKLKKKDVVHHVDGDRLNNSVNNLMVYRSNGKHLSAHSANWPRNKKGKWVKLVEGAGIIRPLLNSIY